MTTVAEAVRLFTIPEVADLLRVSRATVYRLIDGERLRTVKVTAAGKKFQRVRADDYQAYVDSLTP